MKEIGIALIGTGFMGKCHALAWNSVTPVFGGKIKPRLEILCDVDEAAIRKLGPEYGFARTSTDWRQVVADPAIDIVSITTPNGLHREMAIAALAAGKHVWCEKPMALDLADATEMADAAATASGKSLLGYNYIRNPALQQAKKIISDGTIGDIIHFRGQVDEDYMADGDLPWSWRARIADGGLGVLGDLTCHLVSLAHYFVGHIKELSADVETVYKTRPLPDMTGEQGVVENEDIAHALVRFDNGVSGTMCSSRTAWGRKNLIRLEIHGTCGMLTFDQERLNEINLFVNEGPKEIQGFRQVLSGPPHPQYSNFVPAPGHQLGFNDLKVIEAAHFLECIEKNDQPCVDFAEGLLIEKVIHGFIRSAQERRWVSVS
ncbi:MAG: Gfo/Idh/MocA family oxidoreductase [Stappiaceae bacterium]